MRPVWEDLADRARALCHSAAPDHGVGNDAHIRIGDRLVPPLAIDGVRLTFHVPADEHPVRLVSTPFRGTDHAPFAGDTRVLGLPVRRIRFRDGERVWDIRFDHPALVDGWHTPEPGARWTDGAATIPRPVATALILEVALARAPAVTVRRTAA